MGVIVVVLKSALPVSRPVDMRSDVDVDIFMDEVAATMLGVLPRIAIEVFTGVRADAFAVIMTALEFPVSTPLEEFIPCAAFDCRPLALLDCDRALHT